MVRFRLQKVWFRRVKGRWYPKKIALVSRVFTQAVAPHLGKAQPHPGKLGRLRWGEGDGCLTCSWEFITRNFICFRYVEVRGML